MAARPFLGVGALVLGVLGMGCSTASGPLPTAAPSNPLPACPDSPNCERVSTDYAVSADRLFARVQTALRDLGPVQMQLDPDSMRAAAVYRVAWVFKDDVAVAVEPTANGSRLHVRSASRVGYSDLGVNRRRVRRLLAAVDAAD
ncbi:MAG: DUF1499 domain-containing protein [Salinibacter sp.]